MGLWTGPLKPFSIDCGSLVHVPFLLKVNYATAPLLLNIKKITFGRHCMLPIYFLTVGLLRSCMTP